MIDPIIEIIKHRAHGDEDAEVTFTLDGVEFDTHIQGCDNINQTIKYIDSTLAQSEFLEAVLDELCDQIDNNHYECAGNDKYPDLKQNALEYKKDLIADTLRYKKILKDKYPDLWHEWTLSFKEYDSTVEQFYKDYIH